MPGFFRKFTPLNVYYKIPDSDNVLENRLIAPLYEKFKLHILIALAPIEHLTRESKGIILIERMEESIELRFEGFAEPLEIVIKGLLGQMQERQKIRF